MEKAAMGGRDHRRPVQKAADGQRIEEEVDAMDVNEIGIAKMAEGGESERVPAAAVIGILTTSTPSTTFRAAKTFRDLKKAGRA